MTSTSAAAKRRRDRAEKCYYCHCLLTHNIPVRLDTDATIEHRNSRNTHPGGRPNLNGTIVIACRRCNEDRAAAEVQRLGIERLRELSGRQPKREITQHTHTSYVSGCFRCDLSNAEIVCQLSVDCYRGRDHVGECRYPSYFEDEGLFA